MTEGGLKRLAFHSLRLGGLLALAERVMRGVPILAYHGVTAGSGEGAGNRRRLQVPALLFEQHLRLLRRRWNPIPLGELLAHLAARRAAASRSVVVTFDDGYRNLLTVALPLLKRYEVPATVFVVTGRVGSRLTIDSLEPAAEKAGPGAAVHYEALAACIESMGAERQSHIEAELKGLGSPRVAPDDDRDLLTWDEIRELRRAGLTIGSHAHVHSPLTDFGATGLLEHLRTSRSALESALGTADYPLAYPYGAWSVAVAAAARAAGYACGLTTDPGLNSPDADAFTLRRFLVGADDDIVRLRASLVGLRGLRRSRRSDRP